MQVLLHASPLLQERRLPALQELQALLQQLHLLQALLERLQALEDGRQLGGIGGSRGDHLDEVRVLGRAARHGL